MYQRGLVGMYGVWVGVEVGYDNDNMLSLEWSGVSMRNSIVLFRVIHSNKNRGNNRKRFKVIKRSREN